MRLSQYGRSCLVEKLVDGLPTHGAIGTLRPYRRRDASPVCGAGVVKVVPTVQTCEAPVETGLVLVVSGTVLREESFAVRCDDRVQVRAEVLPGVLGE